MPSVGNCSVNSATFQFPWLNMACKSTFRRTWANTSSRATHTQATWAQPASSPPPSGRAARTSDWSRFPSWDGIPGRPSGKSKVRQTTGAAGCRRQESGSQRTLTLSLSSPGSSGLPGDPAHPGAAVRHERLLRQVLEEEKHPGRRSQGSRQLVRSQVSQRLAVSLQLASHRPVIITVSPPTCVCRHHRIRENTIASFKSAAKHVSHSRVFRCKFSLFVFPLKKHWEPSSLQDIWQFGAI